MSMADISSANTMSSSLITSNDFTNVSFFMDNKAESRSQSKIEDLTQNRNNMTNQIKQNHKLAEKENCNIKPNSRTEWLNIYDTTSTNCINNSKLHIPNLLAIKRSNDEHSKEFAKSSTVKKKAEELFHEGEADQIKCFVSL